MDATSEHTRLFQVLCFWPASHHISFTPCPFPNKVSEKGTCTYFMLVPRCKYPFIFFFQDSMLLCRSEYTESRKQKNPILVYLSAAFDSSDMWSHSLILSFRRIIWGILFLDLVLRDLFLEMPSMIMPVAPGQFEENWEFESPERGGMLLEVVL